MKDIKAVLTLEWLHFSDTPIFAAYGNIGYGEFKGGAKNYKGFVPNMIIFQEKKIIS